MGPTPPYIFLMSGTRYTNLCQKSPGEWRACFSFLPLLQSWQGQPEATAQELKCDTQTLILWGQKQLRLWAMDNDNITENCSKLYCMVHARHTPTYIPTPPYPHPLTSPHTHTHMHIHTHTCTSTHTRAHPHTHEYPHTHMHIHTHAHPHTHTHAHPHTP